MRANVVLDDDLIKEAPALSGVKTQKKIKKEFFIILLLLVMAVTGIYIIGSGRAGNAMASSDTKSGHYPCNKPPTPRKLCKTKGVNCRAWAIYDACVDGSDYCD